MCLQHYSLLSVAALKRCSFLLHNEASDIVGDLFDEFVDSLDLKNLSLVE